MAMNAKNLKALGFEMIDGQLVPIRNNPPKLKNNSNAPVSNKINKQSKPSPIIKTPALNQSKKSNNADVYNPQINQKNNFFKFLGVEDLEHIKVVNFLKANYPDVVWFHPPNEGERSSFQKYKMSLMGALRGISDFVIAHPKVKDFNENGRVVRQIIYCGLFIELKAHEHNRIVQKGKQAGKTVKAIGKASKEQLEVIDRLNKVGYKACVCYGAQEVINIINDYFRN